MSETGILVGLGSFILFLVILGVLIFIFWIWMMVDVLCNQGVPEKTRWIWFCLMLGLSVFFGIGWIVSIIYYFTDRKKRQK